MRVIKASSSSPTEQRSETFAGTVFVDPTLPRTDDVAVNTVTFEPGARTYWHSHETGQLLIVIAGAGFVQLRGAPAEPICVGDTVWTSPDEEHWHGAGPRSLMTHIAVSLGTTRWLDEVASHEYVDL